MEGVKGLDRMAEKSARNLLDAIEKSKSGGLNRLIYGLGISHIGEHTAWVLANHFGSISKLEHDSQEELSGLAEMGPVMAESVYNFFRNKENIKIITKLKNAGVSMETIPQKAGIGPLSGKTVVITGTLKSFSRSGAEEIVRKSGGNPSSSVSKNTDYLVAGLEAGSKLEKAKALGVKIISEDEFKKILE